MNDRLQRLRRDLTEAVAPPTCPTGYRVRTFAADDAPTVHRLLEVGYAQGGGHIGAFEEWWPSLRDDDEFAPDLCFLALNERQEIVGVAQCWTSAFIKDLVVHPLARRRGIATALLRRVFWEFRRRGVKHVDLKVQVDNPTGAVRLYKELGMREVALDGSLGLWWGRTSLFYDTPSLLNSAKWCSRVAMPMWVHSTTARPATAATGQNEPCHSLRRHGRSTSVSGPAGSAGGASASGQQRISFVMRLTASNRLVLCHEPENAPSFPRAGGAVRHGPTTP